MPLPEQGLQFGRSWPTLAKPTLAKQERNGGGKGKKKGEILGPSTLSGPHPFGAPPFRGSTLRGPTFSRFGPPTLSGPHPFGAGLAKVGQIEGWPTSGLAKIGQIRMAKVGLAKVGLSRSAGLGCRTRPMQTSPTVLSPMYSIKSSFN